MINIVLGATADKGGRVMGNIWQINGVAVAADQRTAGIEFGAVGRIFAAVILGKSVQCVLHLFDIRQAFNVNRLGAGTD